MNMATLFFSSWVKKDEVFANVRSELENHNFSIVTDEQRPWGGFFVIDGNQAENFITTYFGSLDKTELLAANKLSPKILIVEAGKRLSWQYHHRRAELWRVIGGNVGIVRSDNDIEKSLELFDTGDLIKLKQGERHRLVGLNDWGIVAEIWQHTNKDSPSDEGDIVRITDDYGR